MAYMGPLTDEFIENFQIDTLFLCVEGIDVEQGVSVVDILDGNTKKVLVKKARKVICIADHSKFNKSFFYKIAPLTDIYQRSVQEHLLILEAMERRDEDAVEQAVRDHVLTAKQEAFEGAVAK